MACVRAVFRLRPRQFPWEQEQHHQRCTTPPGKEWIRPETQYFCVILVCLPALT